MSRPICEPGCHDFGTEPLADAACAHCDRRAGHPEVSAQSIRRAVPDGVVEVWTADLRGRPVRLYARKFGWPNECWEARLGPARPTVTQVQYKNTHVLTEAEALAYGLRDQQLQEQEARRLLVEAEKALDKRRAEYLEAARSYGELCDFAKVKPS